mgnify:CR=1 FL=1
MDYVVGETLVEQFHLLQGVDGMHLVTFHQVGFEHLPEWGEVGGAHYLDACLLGSPESSPSVFAPPQMLLNEDDSAYITLGHPCLAHPIEGVEVFLGGKLVVHPWDGFIDHLADALVVEVLVQFLKQLDDICHGHVDIHEQSSIGESLMGMEGSANAVGWQNGVQMVAYEEQE